MWECRTRRANPEEPSPFGEKPVPSFFDDGQSLTPRDFDAAVAAYPDLAIEDALTSPSTVVRGLALLDGRTGKRRLLAFDPDALAHPLERTLFALRLRADGLRLTHRAQRFSF